LTTLRQRQVDARPDGTWAVLTPATRVRNRVSRRVGEFVLERVRGGESRWSTVCAERSGLPTPDPLHLWRRGDGIPAPPGTPILPTAPGSSRSGGPPEAPTLESLVSVGRQRRERVGQLGERVDFEFRGAVLVDDLAPRAAPEEDSAETGRGGGAQVVLCGLVQGG
jgi:hypothetical protein